jgi:hypothetical protein
VRISALSRRSFVGAHAALAIKDRLDDYPARAA